MSFFVDMHFVLLLESMFFFLLLLFVSLLDFVLLLRIGMEFERFFFSPLVLVLGFLLLFDCTDLIELNRSNTFLFFEDILHSATLILAQIAGGGPFERVYILPGCLD
jgi:hypothetical protein